MKYIDMHCDTITALYKSNGDLLHNDLHNDLKKMKDGECMLQNFAIFTDISSEDSSFTKNSIEYYYKQLDRNKDLIRPVYTYEDILNNDRNGLISSLLTLEEGSVIDGDLSNLDWYYKQGVRMITLTWNYPNGIGHPNFVYDESQYKDRLHQINEKDGLTDFGIEYVRRMSELGIIVDVSHLSDKGFYDVLEYTNRPFVASHSNARSLCNVGRNLSDDMIRKLSDRGGVTGLNFCSAFIKDNNERYTSIEGMVEHIRYIVNVGGIDCIGLGSDFDGIHNKLEIKNASGLPRLYEALRKYFSEEDIEKIFYKNVLRVYKEFL